MPICVGRFDRDEFVQICQKLLGRNYHTLIETAILNGGRNARLEREWLAEAKSVFLPLPDYEIHIIETPTSKEYLNSTTGYVSVQKPSWDPRSFSSMAFTAARILLPLLCFCLEQLIQKQAPGELQQSCESVINAASVFTVLEGEHGPTKSSDLDAIQATAHSISLQEKGVDAELPWLGPSYVDLKVVQEEYYGLLRSIQGFLSSLQCPTLEVLENSNITSPSLPSLGSHDWRRLQMPRRANEIEHQADVCRNWRQPIEGCRESRNINMNEIAEETNVEGRKALAEVRTLQLSKNVLMEHPNARLHVLSADGLKKTGIFKSRSTPIPCPGKLGVDTLAPKNI